MTCSHVISNVVADNERRAGLYGAISLVWGIELDLFVDKSLS